MNYLVCIDDTDMPGTKGTGWLAQEMGEQMARNGQGSVSPISRHQLFVHEDVPYTSHNSAMCFELSTSANDVDETISFMAEFLKTRSQKGSDPGLCVVRKNETLDRRALVRFGRDAKTKVLTKADAYSLAASLDIHLSEHGGTGQGVVGALAGIGLRLDGNDGRYRGWYHLGRPGEAIRVDTLCRYDFVDDLVTENGKELSGQTHVLVGSEKTKTVRLDHRQVIVVKENENGGSGIPFRTITKQEAKHY